MKTGMISGSLKGLKANNENSKELKLLDGKSDKITFVKK
jgi:hypothetical protein